MTRPRAALMDRRLRCPRLPLDPLLACFPNTVQAAAAIGLSTETLQRWRRAGGVPLWRADEIAVRVVGVHPVFIWEDWYTMTADDEGPDVDDDERPDPTDLTTDLRRERQADKEHAA